MDEDELDDPELQQTLKALDATDPSRIGMDEDEDKDLDDPELQQDPEGSGTPTDPHQDRNGCEMTGQIAEEKASRGDSEAGDDERTVGGQSEAPSCGEQVVSPPPRTTATTRSRAEAATSKISNIEAARAASRAGGAFNTSSVAADDVARMENLSNKAREAEDVLRENPVLKGVHSTASARAMLARTEMEVQAV
eukprot:gene31071-6197_t